MAYVVSEFVYRRLRCAWSRDEPSAGVICCFDVAKSRLYLLRSILLPPMHDCPG